MEPTKDWQETYRVAKEGVTHLFNDWLEDPTSESKAEMLKIGMGAYDGAFRAAAIDKVSPFHILGFFEELIDPVTDKLLGQRSILFPAREMGFRGRAPVVFHAPFDLVKNGKRVTIHATPARPKTLVSELQILCGAVKNNQ